MTTWIMLLAGLLLGVLVGWMIASARLRTESASLRARSEAIAQQVEFITGERDQYHKNLLIATEERVVAQTRLKEQTAFLEDAQNKLSNTFKSLAAEALATNNQGFLTLAEEKFKGLKNESAQEMEMRRKAIESLVQPLLETINIYQQETKALAGAHMEHFGQINEQLKSVAMSHTALQSETAKLVNALRSPQVRGRWGEITLKRTAELAGMALYCDFVEQESVMTEDGALRPDMVVRLPAERELVVDSKVPLESFIASLEARTDEERRNALDKYAAQVGQHVDKLSSKKYWEQFQKAPDFVVMFIPNDSFLAVAVERRPSLIEDALIKKVVIATPTTFIALLKAIAYGWQQQKVSDNAQHIFDLGKELAERIAVMAGHINSIGKGLGEAVDAYNRSIGSLESRVLVTARKFKELEAGCDKEVEELKGVDRSLRAISPPEPDKN